MDGTRLCDGLAILEDDNLVVIDAGWTRVAFSGASSGQLSALLPLLDGQRTTGELADSIGASPQRVAALLDRLGDEGLLERSAPPTNTAVSPARTFLSRNLAVCDKSATSSTEVAATLAQARVFIAGSGPFGDALTHDLLGAGVPIVPYRPGSATEIDHSTSRRVAVVVHDGSSDFAGTADQFLDAGLDVLRVAIGNDGYEVGPMLSTDYGPCGGCCDKQLDPLSSATVETSVLAASVAAARLLSHLGGPFDSALPREVTRASSTYGSERLDVVPVAGCDRCEPDLRGPAGLAWAYEVSVEAPPPRLASSAKQSKQILASISRLQAERVQHAWSPRLNLDEHPPATFAEALALPFCPSQATVTPVTELDLATVTALIRYAVGRRSDSDRRWTPSGGDFGSSSVTLLAPEGWCPLPGSVFRYDDRAHQLRAVSRSTASAPLEHLVQPGSVVLVLTSAVKRLAGKYGPFALRLGHLDAGCVAFQLALIAHHLGVLATVESSWGAELSEAIELSRDEEIVTGIIRLAAVDAPTASGPDSASHRAGEVFQALTARAAPRTAPRHAHHHCRPEHSLRDVLEHRKSAPKDRPTGSLTTDAISNLIDTAEVHHQGVLSTSDNSLPILVGANRTDTLRPGIWTTSFDRTWPGSADLVDSFAHEHLDAAAFVLIGGSVPPDIASDDLARLWMSAGSLGYSLALAATQHDLVARPLGGARHEVSSHFRQLHPEYRHLFTVAIGSRP